MSKIRILNSEMNYKNGIYQGKWGFYFLKLCLELFACKE